MKTKKLSKKEKLFCELYTVYLNAREAATQSGYLNPENAGNKLMARQEILDEIAKIKTRKLSRDDLTAGLKRLAFGSVADCLKLIISDGSEEFKIEEMDFFNISEIKKPKGGGIEIKFFDRLKALDKLSQICESTDEDSTLPFYEAIRKSAKALENKNG